MNAIDLLLLLLILFSAWLGWRRGAIAGIADLFGWVGSLICAFLLYSSLSQWLGSLFHLLGVWAKPVAFISLLIISRLVLGAILFRVMPKQAEVHQGTANRAFGLIPGVINGMINAIIVAALVLTLPLSDTIKTTANESKAAALFAGQLEWFDETLAPIFDPAVKEIAKNKAIYPDANSTTTLNFKVANSRSRPDLEKEMLQLVNKERAAQGIPPLTWEPLLLQAARSHSNDMFARGYFSHYSLEGKTVSDRLRQSKVRFLVAGENLALAQSIPMGHEGLMNSPGHRANILNKSYGRMAIGVQDGGIRGLMITQVFKN